MAEHYTKNTVSVTKYCSKCKAMTLHNVQGGRAGACQDCIARLEAAPKQKPKPVQKALF